MVLGRAGSATQRTVVPAVERVVFDPMTSWYVTWSRWYVPRQVYPAALLPLPPMFPTQSVTVTRTGMPCDRRRAMRALSFIADMKLTTTMTARTVITRAPATFQNRRPIGWTAGPRSDDTS